MPAETFFCPHCQRQLMKSAAAFVMGEVGSFAVVAGAPRAAPCPDCHRPIDLAAMIAGRYDAPPPPPKAVVAAVLVGVLLVGAFFTWRHVDEKARVSDPFRMRLFYAEDIDGHDPADPVRALAYYEAAARGLGEGPRATALARIGELVEHLRRESPQLAHQDVLLSAAAPTATVHDAAGAPVGRLTLREDADAFDVDFTLAPERVPTGDHWHQLVGRDGHFADLGPGGDHTVSALRVPFAPDPDLLVGGGASVEGIDHTVELHVTLDGVPSAVGSGAPAEEVREGLRAVRVHVVFSAPR